MTEYDYFIAGFQSSDAEYVRQLIVSQPSLAATFASLETSSDTVEGVDGFNLRVVFTVALAGAAQTLLAGLMSTYMTSVPVAKLKKLSELKTTVQNFIEAHYDILTRQQFLSLYTLAKFDLLVNRAAYVRPGLDWLNSILTYAVSAAGAIQALTLFSDVNSYVINVGANVSPDPLLTIGAAVQIVN